MARVVVASDNLDSSAILTDAVAAMGLSACATPRKAIAIGSAELADAAILLIEALSDDASIAQLCKRVRQTFDGPLVIFGTSLSDHDVVGVLDAGADDALILPMRDIEITARLRAILRRVDSSQLEPQTERLVAGDIEISLEQRRAYRRGRELALSPTELKLLTTLVRGVGRPLSHAGIISQVWGPEYVDSRNYLRLYIRYLRKAIEDDPNSPQIILNEWGTGYRLEASPAVLNVA